MAEHTYMWILVVRFDVHGGEDDRTVIEEIIDAPQYGYDFASPFDGADSPSHPDIHGRWWRRSISADRFEPCSAARAVDVVRSWADDQPWTEPFTQPPDVRGRLESIYAILRQGQLYKLDNPPADCEHDYGWVMGGSGFHEFLIIDRSSSTVTLVVTCDD